MDNNKEPFNNPPKNGKCVGHPTELWFPHHVRGAKVKEFRERKEKTRKAITICETCDVSEECLQYSLRYEPWGIWGGKNELQRAAIRVHSGVRLARDGKIFIPGLGNRNANGEALVRQPKSLTRPTALSEVQ